MDEREEQQELNSRVGQLTTTVQALDHKLQMVSTPVHAALLARVHVNVICQCHTVHSSQLLTTANICCYRRKASRAWLQSHCHQWWRLLLLRSWQCRSAWMSVCSAHPRQAAARGTCAAPATCATHPTAILVCCSHACTSCARGALRLCSSSPTTPAHAPTALRPPRSGCRCPPPARAAAL